MTSGVHAQIEVKPSYGLNDQQISAMLKDALGAGQADRQLRMLREAQIDARRLLDATEAALQSDRRLLSPTEALAIGRAMAGVADALETEGSVEDLKAASAVLSTATAEFAARRMNASIHQALAGRGLDSLV